MEVVNGSRRIRVLRIIARLNMGGPAHHVALLSGMLDPKRYDTLLLHGEVGPGEASLVEVARRREARLEIVPGLGPELRPTADVRALIALVKRIRDFRPDIVHTHTAKAGMLGRLAAWLAGRPRPVIVHTYHGHVLEGYFDPLRNQLYRTLERWLGRASDLLIGVSAATVEDLVRLRIAPRRKFRVVPIGLDLEPFLTPPERARPEFRREAGVAPGELLVTFVGRLVPIKRVDLAIRALAEARQRGAAIRLAVVGDGEDRPALERLARDLGVEEAIAFFGYRDDMVAVTAGADLALLTSANEGTPVSLIEAGAAGRPAVATAVGGVTDVVTPATGVVVQSADAAALGAAIAGLAADPGARTAMGEAARRHVLARFSVGRLLEDIDAVYLELTNGRPGAATESEPVQSRATGTAPR
jgi:glycosyltransferase involved in cell wall biosynthesis